ncbi:hypothetical protein BD324DRAFT_613615 [Kockovaella imperatae]|uniref:Secreted protein n=1 Tax=Kockovaella imperatae TaxID=4999 RepID=A0A1Y1UUF6_9TREE|nr:hypothetical protein BD324DRAFT_613615 [Kockovaella imperatae]ORX41204.1 hypothetical protein BD324DRAFT_613615 [Kockovaella imperatae]
MLMLLEEELLLLLLLLLRCIRCGLLRRWCAHWHSLRLSHLREMLRGMLIMLRCGRTHMSRGRSMLHLRSLM